VSLTSSRKLVNSRSVVHNVWPGSVKLHARCASCSVSTSVSPASVIPPTLHICLHVDTAVIRRQAGEDWEQSDKTVLFRISGSNGQESAAPLFSESRNVLRNYAVYVAQ
jgi:hypothetical protein